MAACRTSVSLSRWMMGRSASFGGSSAAAATSNQHRQSTTRGAASMLMADTKNNNNNNTPATPSTATTTTTSRSSSFSTTSQQSSSIGGGPARSLVSSGIGTDVEMIAANNRQNRLLATAAAPSSQDDEMKDEYGAMDDSGQTYVYPGDFVLENGNVLPNAQLRYQTYGTLNEDRTNVLVVCHALTGNASLHAWWGDLLGPNRAFDTNQYYVVCCNILGSCYGSTSPVSINPATGTAYGKDFPDISVQDTVRLQLLLLQNELQVQSIKAVIGGSFGGMQAMEFAVQAGIPETGDFLDRRGEEFGNRPFLRSVIPIACGAHHSAWQIAISEVQRQAIYRDPAWSSDNPFAATAGLEIARQLGMVSYRTPTGYVNKFGRALKTTTTVTSSDNNNPAPAPAAYGSNALWQVKSYLQYQGTKFLDRFDPVTYVKMTEQMDSHDVTRGRSPNILQSVQIPALVLGIDSDVLYPIAEQEYLAEQLPQGQLKTIHSDDGHDGFLLEQDQVAQHIVDFLAGHD